MAEELIKGFNRAQRAYDNMSPPDDDCTCPSCGEGEVVKQHMGIGCTKCDWYEEPDFEAMLEAKAHANDWRH